MKWTAADHQYMARALMLARRGLNSSHPNPRVGCVLVRNGEIVGEGWHEYAGGKHAEIMALDQAGDAAKNATCYVNLEPCNHHGRTPPCTEALIRSGIGRLIATREDPNPLTAGKGLEKLKSAGVNISYGLMGAEGSRLNKGFIKRMTRQLPHVCCKLAASLDGRTATAGGESKWITSKSARLDVQRLRARSSAVMTGIGTVLSDDPRLDVRDIPMDHRKPLRVILDRRLRCPHRARMLTLPGRVLIFTCSENEQQASLLKSAGAEVVVKGKDDFLYDVLHHLAKEEEVNEILVEAGSTMTGSLMAQGYIDEVVMYQAAVIMGDSAQGLFHLPHLKDMDDRIELKLTDIRYIGSDIRMTLDVNNQ